MTNPAPVLSVVIPAYNVARFVGAAVESALGQTFADIEVIVVDDGSTDDTPTVVRSYKDPRLKLISQANGGLSSARNSGIRAALGRYVGFLDGDDTWDPDKVRRHVEVMDAAPEIGITYSHSSYMDEDGALTGRVLISTIERPTLAQMIMRNRVGNGSSPVVRADCFRKAGLFDERLRSCEDWEMWVRILRDTRYGALLIPEFLTNYRINTRSLSMNFDSFLRSAEAAAARIAADTPGIPARVVRRGLATAYRIAGTKALNNGSRATAARLLARAVAICPWLPLVDLRLAGTVAMMGVPHGALAPIHRLAGWTLRGGEADREI